MRTEKLSFSAHKAASRFGTRPLSLCSLAQALLITSVLCLAVIAQNNFDGRRIGKVDIDFGPGQTNQLLADEYRKIARSALGETYSASRVRAAIADLYDTRNVEDVSVSASLDPSGEVAVIFNVKRKAQAQRVTVEIIPGVGDKVTEEDLLFKLDLLTPGTPITQQVLRNNATVILEYLYDHGFYQADVKYQQVPLSSSNDVGVKFTVTTHDQAIVSSFNVNIEGYTKPIDPNAFQLEPNHVFSRDRLTADVAKIRALLKKENFIAPEIEDPKYTHDPDTNRVAVTITGKVGPAVKVLIETEAKKPQKATQTALLPVLRDGTLDYSAIDEGRRRLENYYQQRGYFFATIESICTVTPQITDLENNPVPNGTNFLCTLLSGQELMKHEVELKYQVDLRDRYKLTDIRLEGTSKLTIEDIKPVLETQEANALGIIPVLGYGRGYTNETMLEDDRRTIESLLHELGYRQAQVHVQRGVSPVGDSLIITFVVDPEGPPTKVSSVEVVGNTAISKADIMAVIPSMAGQNFSRARMRTGVQRIRELYANRGYYDARITATPSFETPPVPLTDDPLDATILYKVEREDKKVVINRVLVEGNEKTDLSAVRKAIALKEGAFLKQTDVYQSEQTLYGTDVFSRVDIKPRPAGDGPTPDTRLSDVIVSLDEQPARLATYGGGYSTDLGPNAFFDIRHVNLFGKLWQGGARARASQRQQLVQLDFINPRFIRDRSNHFAPLTIGALYQRDTTVTRFFRSTFDRGTFGIVQRVDAKGNPIDVFGNKVGSPTLNRLSVTAETNRTISRGARSLVYFRYRFEDVRLFNIGSLLIKDLLEPERKTRISGFGATFVRDTRRNCTVKFSILEYIAKGESSSGCRYSATDATNGQYITAEYNVSVPALGANIGFQKFQASYNYYYSFGRLRNTTFAARGIIGVGSVFKGGDRFNNSQFPSFNGLLPISERFFAGGANNLRGFAFEEAGPRAVIVPQGIFRNSKGEQVFLDPFTVTFGGNALAVVNLEGRVPLTRSLRAVPFYDGGNVFRRAGDIFKRPAINPNDVVMTNQRAIWTHTVGLGFRLKTPIGGDLGIDYGYLMNPPTFLIPQASGPNALYRLRQGLIHFQFAQAF